MITIEHDNSGSSVWDPDDWPSAVYALGMHAPHYPVPSCIVHVVNAGLANGLEQRNSDGSLAFKIWDTPSPDGEYVTGNMFDATPWSDDIDVTDWY